jgi:TonB family protein
MAYSPMPPPPSAGAGASSILPLRSLVPSAANPPPDAAAIFQSLRQAIAGGTRDFESIVGAISEAARFLTGASAAAIAMRQDGVVVCRGRSGDAAPELGAHLSLDSGISGECLRTGKTLRCDDTLKDFRVDREVCQRLGLRSIAVVPLRGRHGVMGVLETFSIRPYAFADEHMDALRKLAKLAETAQVGQFASTSSSDLKVELEGTPLQSRFLVAVVSAALLRIRDTIATRGRDLLNSRRTRHWWVTARIAALLAVSLGGWKAWHLLLSRTAPSGETAPVTTLAQPAEAEIGSTAAVSATDLVWTPDTTRPLNGIKPSPAMSRVQRAAEDEPEVVITHPVVSALPPNPHAPPETLRTGSPSSHLPSLANAGTFTDPLHLVVNSTDGAKLGGVIATSAVLPHLTVPVSQGVSGGTLERKVQPVYPSQAMSLHLQGSVVLQATIAEDGSVQDLRVIHGHPTLAKAAMDAVQQWRYRPYLLNGEPTRMLTQITVTFEIK